MKRVPIILWLALMFLLGCIAAKSQTQPMPQPTQTNTLYGWAGDYGVRQQSRVTVTLTLMYPNPRTVNNIAVRQDPIATQTDTNGYFQFTNILWGHYTYSLSGAAGTVFDAWVGTNTIGPCPVASLSTNANNWPAFGAFNYTVTFTNSGPSLVTAGGTIILNTNQYVSNLPLSSLAAGGMVVTNLTAGANVTVTPNGNSYTIASSGGSGSSYTFTPTNAAIGTQWITNGSVVLYPTNTSGMVQSNDSRVVNAVTNTQNAQLTLTDGTSIYNVAVTPTNIPAGIGKIQWQSPYVITNTLPYGFTNLNVFDNLEINSQIIQVEVIAILDGHTIVVFENNNQFSTFPVATNYTIYRNGMLLTDVNGIRTGQANAGSGAITSDGGAGFQTDVHTVGYSYGLRLGGGSNVCWRVLSGYVGSRQALEFIEGGVGTPNSGNANPFNIIVNSPYESLDIEPSGFLQVRFGVTNDLGTLNLRGVGGIVSDPITTSGLTNTGTYVGNVPAAQLTGTEPLSAVNPAVVTNGSLANVTATNVTGKLTNTVAFATYANQASAAESLVATGGGPGAPYSFAILNATGNYIGLLATNTFLVTNGSARLLNDAIGQAAHATNSDNATVATNLVASSFTLNLGAGLSGSASLTTSGTAVLGLTNTVTIPNGLVTNGSTAIINGTVTNVSGTLTNPIPAANIVGTVANATAAVTATGLAGSPNLVTNSGTVTVIAPAFALTGSNLFNVYSTGVLVIGSNNVAGKAGFVFDPNAGTFTFYRAAGGSTLSISSSGDFTARSLTTGGGGGTDSNGKMVSTTTGSFTALGSIIVTNSLTATNGFFMPTNTSYLGPICTNGNACFWNSNGQPFLRYSSVGAITSTDKALTP